MIEELVSAAFDPSFGDSILPRTCRAYAFRLHCAGSQKIGYFLAKLAITIQNRVAVGTRFRECISQLLHYPGACRMFRNIEMENPAAAVFDDKETIQNSEGESRHGEKIHGRNKVSMVAQKGRPELAFLVGGGQSTDIARNSAFRDLKTKLEKLTMNSRRAPGRILFNHPADDSSKLSVNCRPANALWS